MDKAAARTDLFQANRDRAAPLLARLKASGIIHRIDGKAVPSISGETFETAFPIDGAFLATVARGGPEDIDRAATAAARAFKAWRDLPATARSRLLHRVADAIEARADDIAVLECVDTGQAHRFMAKAAVRAAENFRFFADRCGEARDAGAGRRLHRGAQARRMDTGDRRSVGATGATGGRARWRPQHGAWHRRRGRQGADRASRHQGDRLYKARLQPLPLRLSYVQICSVDPDLSNPHGEETFIARMGNDGCLEP